MSNLYFLAQRTSLVVCLQLLALFSVAQLSGTYTLGTEGNYATFQQAADALIEQGINGLVTFLIASGTYSEQLVIETISGSSEEHTVFFHTAEGDTWGIIHKKERYFIVNGGIKVRGCYELAASLSKTNLLKKPVPTFVERL